MVYILIPLLVLGFVQGVAEFLPVSSSGHLVILENCRFINDAIFAVSRNSELFINVSLHLASLLAVIIFLWKDLVELVRDTILAVFRKNYKVNELIILRNIVLASIPAGIVGLFFHDFFEKVFSSVTITFTMLIVNGVILISTKKIPLKSRKIEEIGVIRPIVIGFFQAFAIIPGISRSGMTIAGGMMSGLFPEESARFSFLIAVPVIAGAGIWESMKATSKGIPLDLILPLLISMLLTLVVALISLKTLFYLVKKVRIDVFGYYTILLGITGLLFIYFN
jgi:undecaprenyl-diphosphatase